MRVKPLLLLAGSCALAVSAVVMTRDLAAPAADTVVTAGAPAKPTIRARALPPPAVLDPKARDETRLAQIDHDLDAVLRTERVDPAWAHATEAAIAGEVAGPRFAGLHLDAVACSATLCKIAISAAPTLPDLSGLVEELTTSRSFRAGGFVRFTDERTVTLFVARAGTNLPRS